METLGRALKMESTSNQDIWWHKNETLFIGKWSILEFSNYGNAGVAIEVTVWQHGQEYNDLS